MYMTLYTSHGYVSLVGNGPCVRCRPLSTGLETLQGASNPTQFPLCYTRECPPPPQYPVPHVDFPRVQSPRGGDLPSILCSEGKWKWNWSALCRTSKGWSGGGSALKQTSAPRSGVVLRVQQGTSCSLLQRLTGPESYPLIHF